MRLLSGLLLALGVLAPCGLAAGPLPSFFWDARFVGKADQYGFEFEDLGVTWKNGRIARGCPDKSRGLIFRVTDPPGIGFGQVFPDPNQKRHPVFVDVLIDPTKLKTAGARAAAEIDSPFVPIGLPVEDFVVLVVERQDDRSLRVFSAIFGSSVGTPLVLPEDTPGITATIRYQNDAVDIEAGSCDRVIPELTPIVTGQPLVFGGNSGFGVGIVGEKGDSAGFAFAISGDIHDPAKQDVLGDLQAIIDLEVAALADLANGMTVQASAKVETARQLLEDQGPPVPLTDPEEFEPPLLDKVDALPESDAREAARKRLGKAGERDAKARDKIDRGRPADLQEAKNQLEKAQEDKVRAKAVLETGVVAEGKGKL